MSNNANQKDLESLRERYHNLIHSPDLGDKEALDRAAKCRELIFHIHDRIEYAENRRGQIATVALAFLAGAVALLLASVVEDVRAQEWVLILRVVALCLFATSATTLVLYSLQINFAYPFIQVTKTWRWFYHYSVSKDYKPPFHTYDSKSQRKKLQKLHLEDLLSYAQKTVKMSPKEELEQDLEQLFLVIVNEKYKNAQLSHLRTVVSWGLMLTIVILIVTAVVSIIN